MQFGLQLNSQHPATENMRARLQELVEQVHLAQAVGFHSIVAPQHYLPAPFQMLQPLPLLARMPVQQPHPPIWMGADSDAAVRRAARLADTWYINPHAKLETLERQMTLYRDVLAEQGKPFPQEIPIRRELFVAKEHDTAPRTCLPYLERKYQTYVSWGQSGALPQEDTLDLPFAELRNQRFIIGSPDDCVEQLHLYHQRLGANHVLLRVQWAGMPQKQVLEAITLVGERIIPHLRDVS
jgi:alkanesulfonate monooxygenase SsuD/methylene tetrahydromethanopterin reductase-like flavin-dependent oxidoreductase (luciferase family)